MATGNGRKRVTFTYKAPEAREVYICGTFNEWDPTRTPMKPDGNGGWKCQIMLPPGRYEYRLCVDGQWVTDPNAENIVPNQFGETNAVREVQLA